jgi:hypothetical protein
MVLREGRTIETRGQLVLELSDSSLQDIAQTVRSAAARTPGKQRRRAQGARFLRRLPQRISAWSRISIQAVLEARDG